MRNIWTKKSKRASPVGQNRGIQSSIFQYLLSILIYVSAIVDVPMYIYLDNNEYIRHSFTIISFHYVIIYTDINTLQEYSCNWLKVPGHMQSDVIQSKKL